MVLSFDLHTVTFQLICKAPIAHPCDPHLLTMCILDNRLCVSERKRKENTQVIWSFDSSGKTWKTMCSLDLNPISSWWSTDFTLLPIANLDKGRILLQSGACIDPLVIHDPHTQSRFVNDGHRLVGQRFVQFSNYIHPFPHMYSHRQHHNRHNTAVTDASSPSPLS
ncbi:hypothetical protein YC2023_094482 [Brassica napus]